MKSKRPKNRETTIPPGSPQPGVLSARVAIPVFACFIAFVVCCILDSSFTIRIAGVLFLVAMFAIVNWHTWKTGGMKTNFGVIFRGKQPVRFYFNALLFLFVELFMLIGAVVHAIQIPS